MNDRLPTRLLGRNPIWTSGPTQDNQQTLELIDLILDAPDETHAILLLYRIVLGRSPDIAGFIEHVYQLRSGVSLRVLAGRFIDSPEALQVWSGPDWLSYAQRNAGVAPDTSVELPAADYCCVLIANKAVRTRFSPLTELLPQGLPLGYPAASRLWRSQSTINMPSSSRQASLAIFFLVTNPATLERAVVESVGASPHLRFLVAPEQIDAFRSICDRSSEVAARPFAVLGSSQQTELLECVEEDFAVFLLQSDRLETSIDLVLGAECDGYDIVLFDEESLSPREATALPVLGHGWDRNSLKCEPMHHLLVLRGDLLTATAHQLPLDPLLVEWSVALRVANHPRDRIGHVAAIGRRRLARGPLPDGAGQLVARAVAEEGKVPVSDRKNEARTMRLSFNHARRRRVSAIVLSRDQPALIKRCVEGLSQRTDYPELEIVVVDNGTTNPAALTYLERLEREPNVLVLREPGPFNWGRFNNLAAARSTGEILLFLNNDIDVLHGDWIDELAGCLQMRDIGAVGAKLLYPAGDIQHAGIALDADGLPFHLWRHADGASAGYCNQLSTIRTVTAVTGACLAVERDVWKEVGGIEEAYSAYFSDVDFCMKIADTGRDIVWVPHVRLLHIEQATFGASNIDIDRLLFQRRWPFEIANEVYANPNLIHGREPRLSTKSLGRLEVRPLNRPRGPWRD